MNLTLKVWRQKNTKEYGRLETYKLGGISPDMSFLEMLDVLNEDLIGKNIEPVAFDHDCREGICGMCSLYINGRAHGPKTGTTTCQLHMRSFKDGDTIVIEPWRAAAFPVLRDLVVNRGAFDRIMQKGGFVSVDTGSAPDANILPIPKPIAEKAMDAAACIGCGACIDACDQVMDKVGYDKGLIRYTSERAMLEHMDNKKARYYIFRPRVLVYIGIMSILLIAFASSVFLRNPLRVDVMRDRGALAREIEGTMIENVYRLQIMNSSENPMKVSIVATGLPGMHILSSQGKEISELIVNPSSNLLIPVKVRVAIDDVKTGTHPISFDIEATESGPNASSTLRVRDEKSSFIVPR